MAPVGFIERNQGGGRISLIVSSAPPMPPTPPAPPRQFFVGLNLSGLENVPPTPPSSASINYLVNRGFLIYRLPLNWRAIQPTAFGPLDPTYVATLHSVLSIFAGLGAQCVFDFHNFGSGPGNFLVGSPQLPITAFVDAWNKVVAEFQGSPALYGIDLMNEWVNGFSSVTAQQAQQAVITSVRAAPYNYQGFIYCEGVNFSGAWNWVSGQSQPFSNIAMVFSDPLNKTKIEAHCYLDRDSSGSHFSYAIESSTPGLSPPPIPTNPTIGVTRIQPWINWGDANAQVLNLGEMGSSSDPYALGGNLNFTAWNVALDNSIALCEANKVEFWYWGAGTGFGAGFLSASPGYGFNPEPFSATDLITKDYSTTGVQAPQMVVLRRYAGNIGSQPTAYALTLPMLVTPSGNPQAPIVTPILYCTNGVASSPFTIYYGGKITSPVTITPHATLIDGTSAGGTFTPATIVLPAGENALATFTYTASQAVTLQISTTNNQGWTDPPTLGFSSQADQYSALDYSKLANAHGLFNRFTPNIGPLLTLQRVTDNQQMDWKTTLLGSTGYLGFDRTAIQTWASQQSGIPIVAWWNTKTGDKITFSGTTLPTLSLNNAASYPEIVIPSGVRGEGNTPVNGQTQFSSIARMNQTSASGLYRMDWFLGPIVFGDAGGSVFRIFNAPINGTVIATVSLGIINGSYHEYGVTYASGVTNGTVSYRDTTQIAQATGTYTLSTAGNVQTQYEFAWFKNGAAPWVGTITNMEIFEGLALSAAQVSSITTVDATYYSTPLPDTLPAVPPTIVAGGIPGIAFDAVPNNPFGAVSILDQNTGSPTDSLVITLSGAAATLTGTGITGTNPYNIAAASAASVTTTLRALSLNTSATAGLTITANIAATSSAGTSSSTNMVLTVQAYQAETPFAAPIGSFTPVVASAQASKGYNLYGMENTGFSPPGIGYPRGMMLDYLAAKGFSNFRLPIASQLAYTTALGLLNSGYVANMKIAIDYAFTKNLYVIIDPHNFGQIWDSTVSTYLDITPAVPRTSTLFADFWRRLSTLFLNYPNVIFGLMNEPSRPGVSAAQWRDGGVIPAIAAIRAVGANQLVTIPGVSFTGAWTWTSAGNAAAFAGFSSDSANNFVFEMHQYLDTGGTSGAGSGTSPVAGLNGSTILDTSPNGLATTWLAANGFQGVIYEFGIAPDPFNPVDTSSGYLSYDSTKSPVVTNSLIQYGNMLTYMQANSAQWPGWSAQAGGFDFGTLFNDNPGGYAYNPEPPRVVGGFQTTYIMPIVDSPQVTLMLTYLP